MAVGAMKNCHTSEIDQTIQVEFSGGVTLQCQHNVTSFALLSMAVTVPCGDEHFQVYGPQYYADHVLYGTFNISSNFSSPIKEKVACCNLTLYDDEVNPNSHQLFNCTLILPMGVIEDADHEGGLSKQSVIGVIIGILVTILLIMILFLLFHYILLWYQCHNTTSGKRDDSGDSDKLALAHSEGKPYSKAIQQSEENHSHSDCIFVAPKYCGNAKKQLVCMRNGTCIQKNNDLNLFDMPMSGSVHDAIEKAASHELPIMMPEGVQEPEAAMEDLPSQETKLATLDGEEEKLDMMAQQDESVANADILNSSVNQTCVRCIAKSQGSATKEKILKEPEASQTSEDMFTRRSHIMPLHKRIKELHKRMNMIYEEKRQPLLKRGILRNGLGDNFSKENQISRVFGNGHPGIYIPKIKVHELDPGKAISKLQQAKKLFSQTSQNELLVEHVPQPPGLQTIVLKEAKTGVHLQWKGIYLEKGNPLDKKDKGIFISKIAIDGAAHKDGRLKEGHRILEINGIPLVESSTSYTDAINALMRSPDTISITVCQGYDPNQVLRKKFVAKAVANVLGTSILVPVVKPVNIFEFYHPNYKTFVLGSSFYGQKFFEPCQDTIVADLLYSNRWKIYSSIVGDDSSYHSRLIEESFPNVKGPSKMTEKEDPGWSYQWFSGNSAVMAAVTIGDNPCVAVRMDVILIFISSTLLATIKEPYKEHYEYTSELSEPVISIAFVLLAMACMQLQSTIMCSQNMIETN